MPPSAYRRARGAGRGGDAALHRQAGDQTDQESRSAGRRAAPSVSAMDITIHTTLPSARRRGRVAGVLPRRPRLRGAQRRRLRAGCTGSRSARPASPTSNIVLAPAGRRPRHHRRRAPDDRRDDGQGHLRAASCSPPRDLDAAFDAAPGRRRRHRPGADRPAVRGARLRPPRPRRQHDPHPGAR